MTEAGDSTIYELILPGERKYTLRDLADESQVRTDELRALWTSAGFADIGDDDRVFTDDDLAIVNDVAGLFRAGLVDGSAAIPGAQLMGQAMYRLAELQAPLVRQYLESAQSAGSTDLTGSSEKIIAGMNQLQTRVWRRHLATATERLMTPEDEGSLTATMAVGFADMVGYTRLSRGLAVEELNLLVSTFETRMQAVIFGGGGWIVKGVGDEVMFAAVDPVAAATIALELQEPHEFPELDQIELEFPQLRVGVAYGDVLQRFGDLFGSVVNLASRLTSATRPGTVLIDDQLSQAIADDPTFRVKSLRPYRARGFRAVHPHLLRRNPQREGEA